MEAVLAQHYEALWGPPARVARFDKPGASVGVGKWDASAATGGVVIYATLGGSTLPAAGRGDEHRHEYFVGLLPERDDVASTLALLAPIGWTEPLGDGHTLEVQGGLWPSTQMDCWLLAHPQVAVVPDLADGTRHVRWLQAVPLFPAERTWKAVHGAASLWARWEVEEVPFWNPDRQEWHGDE